MDYTKEDILKIVEEEDIKFIRLQFTDINGHLKNVAITASQLDKALDNKCTFDGSSIEGFVRIEESDMYLRPDLSTFSVLPWRPKDKRVARLICDVYTPEGYPFEGDPRYRLKKALEKAEEMGYEFNVGPECEFFVFHTDEYGRPTTVTHDTSSYFDLGAYELGSEVRRDICLNLEEMGFEIEASHHEVARGQQEIDFRYAEALHTADNVMTFKFAVQSIAKKHGVCATFMPKPLDGENGSGMHINMSLMKDGRNVFYDKDDPQGNGLSQEAYYFIAGIMNHIKGMTAICNPTVNSYKRLVAGYEAPVYIAWSSRNRSPLIRIPAARGMGTRIELRSPDPSANPYLVLACCLEAGLDGIRNKMMPPKGVDGNIFEMSETRRKRQHIENLPENLHQAIEFLKKDVIIKECLGEHLTKALVLSREKEWDDYRTTISPWEIEHYLKN